MKGTNSKAQRFPSFSGKPAASTENRKKLMLWFNQVSSNVHNGYSMEFYGRAKVTDGLTVAYHFLKGEWAFEVFWTDSHITQDPDVV